MSCYTPNYEAAIEILSKTEDGDLLDGWQLKLVEDHINGFSTEKGRAVFEELHRRVLAGTWKGWVPG